MEKRRRRRESHNAVERRRRDNINDRIQDLSILVPEIQSDTSNRLNKGVILKKTTDYIRKLQGVNSDLTARVQEMEARIAELDSIIKNKK